MSKLFEAKLTMLTARETVLALQPAALALRLTCLCCSRGSHLRVDPKWLLLLFQEVGWLSYFYPITLKVDFVLVSNTDCASQCHIWRLYARAVPVFPTWVIMLVIMLALSAGA